MSTRASLTDSLKQLARGVEENLSSHPRPETLLAYCGGELAPTESAAVEEHITWCRECSDILDDLPQFLSGEVPEADPREKSADWSGLMDQVNRTERSEHRPAVAETSSFWPRSAQLIAAILVLSVGASVFWVANLKGRLNEALEPRPNIPIYDLDPPAAERAGEEALGLELAARNRAVLILNPLGSVPPGAYTVRFVSADGVTVWTSESLEPTEFGNFNLELVGGSLPPGRYRIDVLGPQPDSERLVGSFVFRLLRSSS